MDLHADATVTEPGLIGGVQDCSPEMDPAIRETFESPEEVEVHKIHPWPQPVGRPGLFFGHRSMGVTRVPSPSRRSIVGKAMLTDLNRGLGAMCFDPEFGVQLRRGRQTIGLLICYRCQNVRVHLPQTGSGLFTFGVSSLGVLRKELRRGGVGWLWFWRRWFRSVA
jgi:hypothetical protein